MEPKCTHYSATNVHLKWMIIIFNSNLTWVPFMSERIVKWYMNGEMNGIPNQRLMLNEMLPNPQFKVKDVAIQR